MGDGRNSGSPVLLNHQQIIERWKKFETFLQEKLPKEVFRAKGILWFSESDMRHVFQLSGIRFDIQADKWRTPPKNQLVLIGRGLDGDALRQKLNFCLA